MSCRSRLPQHQGNSRETKPLQKHTLWPSGPRVFVAVSFPKINLIIHLVQFPRSVGFSGPLARSSSRSLASSIHPSKKGSLVRSFREPSKRTILTRSQSGSALAERISLHSAIRSSPFAACCSTKGITGKRKCHKNTLWSSGPRVFMAFSFPEVNGLVTHLLAAVVGPHASKK